VKLAVTVSPDRQQAVLQLPAGVTLTVAEVRALVRDAGVVYGSSKDAIKDALVADEHDRQFIIARGQAAANAQSGRLRPAIADHELPKQVKAGQDLGEYREARRAVDGMGVNGLPIVASRVDRLYAIDHGLRCVDGRLIVEEDGWFYLDPAGDYCADIHGKALTADEVEVTIAANRTKVSVDVPPGCYVPLVVMKHLIDERSIKHGLEVEQMRAAAKTAEEVRVLIVARATPAKDGGDASLAHQLAEHPAFEPDEHGDIHFRDWNSIIQVTEGQLLADLSAATEGIDGCDVLGQAIPAKPGAEVSIDRFLGEGVVAGPEGKQILAARSGVYQRTPDGKVNVIALVVIDGNVDLHSGSIETDYAVIINGDIKEGFRVKSGSDIQVRGVIEDARVTAQGSLEVHGGILPGKNRVKAHGNVSCTFAREREIKCADLVARESLTNCTVLATGGVTVKDLAGGHLRANGNLICETLGSRIEAETQVHIGIDPFLRSQLETARQRKGELEEKVGQTKERAKLNQVHLDRLARKFLSSPRPEIKNEIDSVASEARRSLRAYKEMQDEIEICSQSIVEIEGKLHLSSEDVHVKVSKTVYPGVTVRIGPTYYNTVFEELTSADFHL
jgi:uncharacterized protein (DUF342 family)